MCTPEYTKSGTDDTKFSAKFSMYIVYYTVVSYNRKGTPFWEVLPGKSSERGSIWVRLVRLIPRHSSVLMEGILTGRFVFGGKEKF